MSFRGSWRPKTVLVADHDEDIARVAQFDEGGQNAVHQPQLLQAVDLLIRRLDDQRAVPIDKEHVRASLMPRLRRRMSRRPIVLFGRADRDSQAVREAELRARIANDEARCFAALSTLSASTQSTSTKFAALGQTCLISGNAASSHDEPLALAQNEIDALRCFCSVFRVGKVEHRLDRLRRQRIGRDDAAQAARRCPDARSERRSGHRRAHRPSKAFAARRDSGSAPAAA